MFLKKFVLFKMLQFNFFLNFLDTRSTSFNTEHKYDRSSEVLTNNDVSSPNTKSQLYQCLKILLQLLFKDTSKKVSSYNFSCQHIHLT